MRDIMFIFITLLFAAATIALLYVCSPTEVDR